MTLSVEISGGNPLVRVRTNKKKERKKLHKMSWCLNKRFSLKQASLHIQNVWTKPIFHTPNVWTKTLVRTQNVWTKVMFCIQNICASLASQPSCFNKIFLRIQNVWAKVFVGLQNVWPLLFRFRMQNVETKVCFEPWSHTICITLNITRMYRSITKLGPIENFDINLKCTI